VTFSGRAPRKPSAPLDEPALFDYAVASLGRRMQTVAELKRKLRRRVEEGPTGDAKIAAVVARLKEYRFLNDEAFATDFTRLRQENQKLGRRRVRQGLIQKGIHPDLALRTLEAAYASVDEAELLREHMLRKRIPRPKDKKETARVLRRLVGAGFAPATVLKVLRNWAPEDESLDQLSDLDVIEPDDPDRPTGTNEE
jgi:regulatory protein